MSLSGKGICRAGIVLSCVALVIATTKPAWALATEDIGNAPLNERDYDEWKGTGIMPVVNHDSRVYHVWVNGNEAFFHRGDAEALNDMLSKFAAIGIPVREVVLRAGPAHTMTFDDVQVPYDWKVHLLTGRAGHGKPPGSEIELGEINPTLTIFVGSGRFKLEEVQVPQGVRVVGPDELRGRYLAGMTSDDSGTRGLAAYRLAELEPYNKENVPLIVALLDDEGVAPYLAAGALGKMGKSAESALPAIREALEKQDGHTKKRFLEVIHEIESAPDPAAKAEAHRAARQEIGEFQKALGKGEPAPQDEEENFILYISNQSFAVNPVDITVHIDGKKVVEGDFDVNGGGPAQHKWVEHQFRLAPGKHTLTVSSKKGKASLKETFVLEGKRWGAVSYWYHPQVTGGRRPKPRRFNFMIRDHPITFQ